MSAPLRCDLLVVGAGPAGSALAASAAGNGLRVILAEAGRHPRPKACAEYASPRIAEELARVGLGDDEWRGAAVPLRGMRVIVGRDSYDVRYADRHGSRTAWGLDRCRFDEALARHAAARGARLFEQTALESLDWHDGRVVGGRLRGFAGRQAVEARWVVGADGARSRVARLVGVERPVRFPRRLGLIAHYEGIPELTDHGEMHVGRGSFIGLAPTPDGELNVGMALPLDGRAAAEERFTAAIASLPAVAHRLRHSRRLTPIRGASPIGHRVAEVAGPGWLLVGDAAGFVDPFTGEGIHRALRSARAAADALNAPDTASAYRAERRAAFAAKEALTWLVQGMLVAPPLLRHVVRRLGARETLGLRLGSALGDCRPASDALSPAFLAAVLRP